MTLALIDERQFAADDAAAHDDERGRDAVQSQRVVAGHDVAVVHGQAGKLQRAGTCGDDHAVAFHGDGTLVRGGFHEPRVDDAAPAPDELHAEAGAGFFKAAAQGGADLFLAGEHGGGIGGRRPLPDDAELGQA